MKKEGRLRQVSKDTMSKACAELTDYGFKLFVLENPADAQDFFIQAKAAYPLDPAISGNVHWDAFADSLWGGLDACPHRKIALVIQDATQFEKASQRDYEIAMSCMADAAEEVEAEKKLEGNEDAEIILLVGIS